MNITQIFLDIDDVCNRFTLFAAQMMGAEINYTDESWWNPNWSRDIVKATNELISSFFVQYTPDTFWGNLPEKAWSEAPVSAEFWMLLSTCAGMVGKENVCFLSTPTKCPLSCSGKLKWIKKFAPPWMHRQYLLGPRKHFCAKPEALLIDDGDENVVKFRQHGGQAILVPRPWNVLHKIAAAGLTEEYLKVELELVQKGSKTW